MVGSNSLPFNTNVFQVATPTNNNAFAVNTNGQTVIGAGSSLSRPSLVWRVTQAGGNDAGFGSAADNSIVAFASQSPAYHMSFTIFGVVRDMQLAWGGQFDPTAAKTVGIARNADGILEVNNGTKGTLTAAIKTGAYYRTTNGVVASLIAGDCYSTNGGSAVTFTAFASVPNDGYTKTVITVSNTTAATPFAVTFPSGTRCSNTVVPAVFNVAGAVEAIFEVHHHAQLSTNIVRVY